MQHIIRLILVLILTSLCAACAGAIDTPEPMTCVDGSDYRFGYSGPRGEYHTAIPGEDFCYSGGRVDWCLYRGNEPADGTNLLGPDAVADERNPDGCAPGFSETD